MEHALGRSCLRALSHAHTGVRKGVGMARWKAPPESLDPRGRQLVVQLRQLRQQLEAVSMRIPVTVKVLLKYWKWFGGTHL
ncbi:hypothetical protein GCM10023080_048810 [Streptomyces pseudoechinosporeus]